MDLIRETLEGLTVGAPVETAALTMYPLLGANGRSPAYDLARDAFDRGTLKVTEVSEGGSVPTLAVVNAGDRPVLLIDGEELVGAKQNRVLNVTVLVPAHQTIAVPVSCVEAGRWHYRTRDFKDADWVMDREGRARKMRDVDESLRRRRTREGSQAKVWAHIADMAARLDTPSPTGAQEAMYARHRDRLNEDVARLKHVDRQVGAVFAVGGRPCGLEIVDSPASFGALLPKLVRSHVLGVVDRRRAAPWAAPESVPEFLAAVASLEAARYPGVGLGEEVRLRGRRYVGAGLVANGMLLHLSVLEDPEWTSARGERSPQHTLFVD